MGDLLLEECAFAPFLHAADDGSLKPDETAQERTVDRLCVRLVGEEIVQDGVLCGFGQRMSFLHAGDDCPVIRRPLG